MYCFDTDVISAVLRRDPPLHLVRRLAALPAEQQFTTSITLGELIYGASKRGDAELGRRVHDVVVRLTEVLPFDAAAAEFYGPLRAELESKGRRLDEPDLRIASIALSRDLTVVTRNVRHFSRVASLRVENWLADG